MSVDAVFVQDGDRFRATDLALGPWYPGALHGGAPAALLVHAVDAHGAAGRTARGTDHLRVRAARPAGRS